MNTGDYFGSLRCNRCDNLIKTLAYSELGDEDHIYCAKCWAMKREEKIKAECKKMADADADADVKAKWLKRLKTPIDMPEYYEEMKST